MGCLFFVCLGPSNEEYSYSLTIHLKINGELILDYPLYKFGHTESLNLSDNIWIFYERKEECLDRLRGKENCDPVTISFRIESLYAKVLPRVKRFGMRLVCEESVQELDQMISNNYASEWE